MKEVFHNLCREIESAKLHVYSIFRAFLLFAHIFFLTQMHCVSTRPSALWVCIYSYCLEIFLNNNAKPWFVFLVWNLLLVKWHHLAIIIILFLPCLACIIFKHENCIQDFYSHIKHRKVLMKPSSLFEIFFVWVPRYLTCALFKRRTSLLIWITKEW